MSERDLVSILVAVTDEPGTKSFYSGGCKNTTSLSYIDITDGRVI